MNPDRTNPKNNIYNVLTTPNPEYFSLAQKDQVIDIHQALKMEPKDVPKE
jgi:hypothetical protein